MHLLSMVRVIPSMYLVYLEQQYINMKVYFKNVNGRVDENRGGGLFVVSFSATIHQISHMVVTSDNTAH